MAERNKNGRFASGNSFGKGRPQRTAEYLTVAFDNVTVDDWQAIVARAVTDARGGDAKARSWLTRLLVESQGVEGEDSDLIYLRSLRLMK